MCVFCTCHTLFNFQGPDRYRHRCCPQVGATAAAPPRDSFDIIPPLLPFVNTFFETFYPFWQVFSPPLPYSSPTTLYGIPSPIPTLPLVCGNMTKTQSRRDTAFAAPRRVTGVRHFAFLRSPECEPQPHDRPRPTRRCRKGWPDYTGSGWSAPAPPYDPCRHPQRCGSSGQTGSPSSR